VDQFFVWNEIYGDPSSNVVVWSEWNSASPSRHISKSRIAQVDFSFRQAIPAANSLAAHNLSAQSAAHDGKRFELPHRLDL